MGCRSRPRFEIIGYDCDMYVQTVLSNGKLYLFTQIVYRKIKKSLTFKENENVEIAGTIHCHTIHYRSYDLMIDFVMYSHFNHVVTMSTL